MDEAELTIRYENTTMYDKDGNVVATLTGDETREIISKEEMSPYIFKAFISIEDERFEEHSGVDWYRTLGAFVTFITHSGESSFGGSTITQQVVKNLTGEKDSSALDGALRKIKEIVRAYQVENVLSKDQILELYLNLIPLGGGAKNIYGVQMASKYYFNKNASDINLVEAAYIAGITSSPNKYNPFDEKTDRTENINKKVKTVLGKMKELGKITEEEYNQGISAVEAGIQFSKGEVSQNNKLNYYLEAARNQVIKDLMEQNKWSEDEARTHLYGNGYQIYTAYDQSIQAEVDEQCVNNASKWYKIIKKKDGTQVQRQGAMVIIDNETGYIVAGAGGLGEKTVANGTNRMELKGHSPGSCMKPIGVLGPSLEEKIITAATVVDDVPINFGGYDPKNWYYKPPYRGLVNVREFLGCSANVPEVILLKQLGVSKSLSYLSKMGIDVSAEDNVGLSLALGGMTNGLTPVELAGAYATIANGGVYRTPVYYTKVTNNAGVTIVEPKRNETRVFSEQNAWILQELLKEPIYGPEATGSHARISGQEVRGKTGTTNGDSSSTFCGFTKYYTVSVWLGFDAEADGKNGGNANSTICSDLYKAVMTKVHTGKAKKAWDKPAGITTAVVCRSSGKLATEECRHDPEGNKAYSEYFVAGTVPKEYCTVHVNAEVCNKSNKLATENCTDKRKQVFITRENRDTDTRWKSAGDAKYMVPTEYCTDCAKPPAQDPEGNQTTPNPSNDPNNNTNGDGNNTNNNTNSTNTNTNTNNVNTNTTNNNINNNTTNTNTGTN